MPGPGEAYRDGASAVAARSIWALPGGAPVVAARAGGHDNHFNLIRIIAASGVLVSHAYPISLGPDAVQPLTALTGLTLGTVCVLVFFAISGFYITRSYDLRPDAVRFLRARVLRLVPALLMVSLVTVLVAGLALTTAPATVFWPTAVEYVLRNLALIKPLYPLPGVFQDNPFGPVINGSLWTLFYEVVCYIGVLLAGITGLLRPRRSFLPALAALGFYVLSQTRTLPLMFDLLAELSLPFVLGGLMWVWRDWVPLSVPLAGLIAAAAVLAAGTAFFEPLLVAALVYGVMVAGFADWRAGLGYNRLGDYSYGVYIYAFPIQQLVVFWGVRDPALNMALALPATLICAVLSWHLVEAPAQRLGRRKRPYTG